MLLLDGSVRLKRFGGLEAVSAVDLRLERRDPR